MFIACLTHSIKQISGKAVRSCRKRCAGKCEDVALQLRDYKLVPKESLEKIVRGEKVLI